MLESWIPKVSFDIGYIFAIILLCLEHLLLCRPLTRPLIFCHKLFDLSLNFLILFLLIEGIIHLLKFGSNFLVNVFLFDHLANESA